MVKMIDNKLLKKVVSDVLGVPVSAITDESSPDNIEKWDSMSHINGVSDRSTIVGMSKAADK